MSRIDQLIKNVNYKTREKPFLYISNDPERAIGLEKLLDNFHIVCVDDSDLVQQLINQGVSVFSLENEKQELNSLFRNSSKLLEQVETIDFINSFSTYNKYFQTFKISKRFERQAEAYHATLLNTSAELNRRFEEKISQYSEFANSKVNFPETIIAKLRDLNYKTIVKKLGSYFVIQFNRGHTGSGTHMIKSEEEFNDLQIRFPERFARVSEFIEGDVFTLNGCVTANGVFLGGLSYQITGIKGLATHKSSTVGNDFAYKTNVGDEVLEKIIDQGETIGGIMKLKGYKGLFGIDLIIRDDEVFIIEINARQPASIPFFTKLQIRESQVPLSLLHILEFMNINPDLDPDDYSRENLQPRKASQVFLRNTGSEPFLVRSIVKTAIYHLTSLKDKSSDTCLYLDEEGERIVCKINSGYSVEDIEGEAGFLLLTQMEGKRINEGNEIARIQILDQAMEANGKLKKWVLDTLLRIKEN